MISNLSRIIMYVVAVISLLVMLFYYAGPKTLNYDELESRVQELTNPSDLDMTPVEAPAVADSSAVDSTATDSTAAAVDSAGMENMAGGGNEGGGVFSSPEVTNTSGVNLWEELSFWEYLVYFRTDIALIWSYILFFLTAIAAIVFPLISVFAHPRALIRLVGVLGGAAIIIVISYVFSSPQPIEITGYTGTSNSDPGTLRMVDTTLFVTYMLFGLAIISIFYSMISRLFK